MRSELGGARNQSPFWITYDGVMIKDNHIGGGRRNPKSWISAVRSKVPHTIKIEVEVENLEQLTKPWKLKWVL